MVSVQFRKKFTGPSLCARWTKKLQTFKTNIHLYSVFQKIVLSSLPLFLRVCYYVDLGDNQWNEVATLAHRSFNNIWSLYLNFSDMINFVQIFDSLKIQNVCNFCFEKRGTKSTNFSFFKEPLFRNVRLLRAL